jgi:hypothetical protein
VATRELHFFTCWGFILVLLAAYFTTLISVRLFMLRKMGTTLRVYYQPFKVF